MNIQFAKISISFFVCILLFISCTPKQNIHGILISQKDIENIVEGETNINFLISKYGEQLLILLLAYLNSHFFSPNKSQLIHQ